MSRDSQQVGSDKPEAGALGLVYKTVWSRGHILPLHTVLRRDAHTGFTKVSRSNIQIFEGQWLTCSPHKARQHTSTENTHILKPHTNAILILYLQKAMQNPCWIFHYRFLMCVLACLKDRRLDFKMWQLRLIKSKCLALYLHSRSDTYWETEFTLHFATLNALHLTIMKLTRSRP